MKASEMVAKVDRKHDNQVDLEDKLDYISKLEQNVYTQIITEPYTVKMNIVANQTEYTIVGYKFEDIIQVTVNGTEYNQGSALNIVQRIFYKQNGKLCIYPAVNLNVVDGIVIVRRWIPPALTLDTYEAYDLLLPAAFEDAYEYYMRSKIAFEQKQAALSNAFSALYNSVIDEFTGWYMSQLPHTGALKKSQDWE